MGFRIEVVEGNRHSAFRDEQELSFLKEKFGKETGIDYFRGFTHHKVLTLRIKDSGKLVGSALIEIYGGTFRIGELVLIEGYNNRKALWDAFNFMEDSAIENKCHKMWLIDHPGLGRIPLYRKRNWIKEGLLRKNILQENEYLYCHFPKKGRKRASNTGLDINIVNGKKDTAFRKKAQLDFLIESFGLEKGRKYFKGFSKKEAMTLEILDGKKLVGSAGIEITDGLFEIKSFIIDKAFRGKNLGTQALRKMESAAWKKGCHKMFLITNPKLRAVDLYKRLGWKVECMLKRNVAGMDEVLMCKYVR